MWESSNSTIFILACLYCTQVMSESVASALEYLNNDATQQTRLHPNGWQIFSLHECEKPNDGSDEEKGEHCSVQKPKRWVFQRMYMHMYVCGHARNSCSKNLHVHNVVCSHFSGLLPSTYDTLMSGRKKLKTKQNWRRRRNRECAWARKHFRIWELQVRWCLSDVYITSL